MEREGGRKGRVRGEGKKGMREVGREGEREEDGMKEERGKCVSEYRKV